MTGIKCSLLPLHQEQALLIPTSSIAEVITERDKLLVMGARDGLIGKVQWRGNSVPILAYEAAIGQSVPPYGDNVRIAVVFNPSGNKQLPYFAFIIQGAPRMVMLDATAGDIPLEPIEHRFIYAHVIHSDISTFVPDFVAIEQFLKKRAN